MKKILLLLILAFGFGQYTFTSEDLNPSSPTYAENIGPESYPGVVTLYYFGYQY
tara:strand:- start:196 stop:357 length:162 start_codon:yes stop_codon:yes gene_type:complete